MNELVVPCIPLLLLDELEEKDMVAVEDMRNRWCSYLGQEMERKCSVAHTADLQTADANVPFGHRILNYSSLLKYP